MCVTFVSERIAIISLYNTNVFVFIAVREPAFCAVRTEVLNTVLVNFSLTRVKDDC